MSPARNGVSGPTPQTSGVRLYFTKIPVVYVHSQV